MESNDHLSLSLAEFNKLVTSHQQRFIHFAYTYTQDEDAAEDAVMESFMALWEKRAQLPADTNVISYVLTAVKNRTLNYLKHKEIEANAAEEMKNLDGWALETRLQTLSAFDPDDLYAKEIMEIVHKTLDGLQPSTRRIFLLSRMEGKPYKEIAAEMEMTDKGVEFHMGRALKALRIALKDYMGMGLVLCLLCLET